MLAKAWFFFSAGSGVFLLPYLNLFLESRGLSHQQLGLLSALRPWVGACSAVLITSLADKHSAHRATLVSCLLVSTALRVSLYFGGNSALFLFAAILLSDFLGAPVGVLADAWVVGSAKQEGDYGSQRLWASVGWGALSYFSGVLLDKYGYGSSFFVHALLCAPCFLAAYNMRFLNLPAPAVKDKLAAMKKDDDLSLTHSVVLDSATHADLQTTDTRAVTAIATATAATTKPQPAGMLDGMLDLLSIPDAALLLSKCAIMGFGIGVIGTFLFIYLKELGTPTSILGLALLMNCVAEVPVFHFQRAILSALSPDATMNTAIGCMVLRLLCYAALPRVPELMPWVVLPVELLHGFTFASSWSAACVQGQRIAPLDKRTTMQGLVQSVYSGIGGGAGALAGTLMFKSLGGQGMFAAAALAVAAAGATVSVVQSGMQQAAKPLLQAPAPQALKDTGYGSKQQYCTPTEPARKSYEHEKDEDELPGDNVEFISVRSNTRGSVRSDCLATVARHNLGLPTAVGPYAINKPREPVQRRPAVGQAWRGLQQSVRRGCVQPKCHSVQRMKAA